MVKVRGGVSSSVGCAGSGEALVERVTVSGSMRVTMVDMCAVISPFLMRFSMSGLIQYLMWRCSVGAAMDEGDAGAVSPEVECGDGGGVFAADDEDVLREVGVGLVVVVLDLGEVFAGNVEVVGQVVVAGGDDEFSGAVG